MGGRAGRKTRVSNGIFANITMHTAFTPGGLYDGGRALAEGSMEG